MKRLSALIFATSLSAWSLAQEAATTLAGTKPDIVVNQPTQPQPVVNGFQFVQMIVALVVVLGLLKFVLPRIVGKVGKGLHTGLNSSIRVEESASFAAGQLHIVSARGKSILIAVTPQGVTTLADLTEEPTAAKPEEPAFFELIDQAKAEPEEVLRDRAVVETFEGEEEEEAGETVDLTSLLQAARQKLEAQEATPKPATGSATRQAASKAYGNAPAQKNASDEISPEELKKRLDRLSKLIG
ncbi:MAG: flagellar biosynthetic protein FliO [Armatimonadetes bacterium]|nr:flagellar biosynthetic protein FliO [Armatimonadota bacterium]